VHGHAGPIPDEASQHLVTVEVGIAVELGGDDLEPRRRSAQADLDVGGDQRIEEPCRIRGA
jgi:hypothetical protein